MVSPAIASALLIKIPKPAPSRQDAASVTELTALNVAAARPSKMDGEPFNISSSLDCVCAGR